MSENQDKTSESLGNLGKTLFGSVNSNQSSETDDFSRLQQMFQDPEVVSMRQRVGQLEEKISFLSTINERVIELENNISKYSKINKKIIELEREVSGFLNIEKKIKKVENKLEYVLGLSDKVEEIEINLSKFEDRSEIKKDIIKQILPIISNLISRQVSKAKEEMIESIVPILLKNQEEQRKLSIRVIGIDRETPDNLNDEPRN